MRVIACLGACAAWLLLSSCGVGGEGTGTMDGTAASGPISGFGSVIVAGQRFDDTALVAEEEVEPGRPQALPLSALRPGMMAELQGLGNSARRLRVVPAVVGPLTQVDTTAGSLVVAGQAVQVDATPAEPTLLEGLASLSDLQVGDALQVHGSRDGGGILRARFIARAAASPFVRVTGAALSLDTAAGTLRLGLLTVNTRGARLLPAGWTPRAGDPVVAWGQLDSAGVLQAQVLQGPEGTVPGDLAAQHLDGRVTRFASLANFTVQGQAVDASLAVISGPAGLVLSAGTLVTVEGPRSAGRLIARRVVLRADSDVASIGLTAGITDFTGAQGFRLRGVTVDTSGAVFQALLPANLGNGVRVATQGRISGARLLADRVQAAGDAADIELSVGEISETDLGNRRFKIIGLEPLFQLSDSSRFVDGDPSAWGDGVRVELRSRQVGEVHVVEQLRYLSAVPTRSVTGLAGLVEPGPGVGEGEFDIGPTLISWEPATQFIGATNTAADLRTGRLVRVTAREESGRLIAIRVDARVAPPGVVLLRGTVTDFASVSSFRIDGQRIDAASALFVPSALSARLAGAYVDVEGTLIDGVLRASRVSDP